MPNERINMSTIVEVEPTGPGHVILDYYMRREAARALGMDEPDEYEPRAVPSSLRRIEAPLWELFKIFGPHIASSVRLPFGHVTYSRQKTDREKSSELHCTRSTRLEQRLIGLASVLGIYGAGPEELMSRVQAWLDEPVKRVPEWSGAWWLGDEVVMVREHEDSGELFIVLGNGRRKHVSTLDGWGGPACKDPRVVGDRAEADEDIEF